MEHLGEKAHEALHMHCQRELFHGQWKILLDDEFISAYRHGIVILCCDGIKRRFYPRIFTYSADYPEKYIYRSYFRPDLLTVSVQIGFLSQPYAISEHAHVRSASFPWWMFLIWVLDWI